MEIAPHLPGTKPRYDVLYDGGVGVVAVMENLEILYNSDIFCVRLWRIGAEGKDSFVISIGKGISTGGGSDRADLFGEKGGSR